MSNIVPRKSQEEALEKLTESRENGADKGLLVMATGTGKTVTCALDTLEFNADRVLFLAHQKEIITQAESEFRKVYGENLDTGFVDGERKDFDSDFAFATVQTLSNEGNLYEFNPRDFDYIVVDEFHHAQADTYRKILNYFDSEFVLGLTATPYLVNHSEEDILDLLDLENPTFEYDIDDAVKNKDLVEFEAYVYKDQVDWDELPENMDKEQLNRKLFLPERDKKVIRKWKEKSKDRKTIVFCNSIEHSDRVAGHFREEDVNAKAIHDEIKSSERKDIVRRFREGDIDVVTSVDMFNEGVDFPDVETIIFMRPTMSKRIFKQQLGRGLRTSEGKEKCIVLDFVHKRSWDRIGWYKGEDFEGYSSGICDECGEQSYKLIEDDGEMVCKECRTDDVVVETDKGSLEIELDAFFEIAKEYDEYKFNHKYSDKFLLNKLKSVFEGKEIISQEIFNEETNISPRTVRERFGGWFNALKKAGFDVEEIQNYSPSNKEIKQDVRKYAKNNEKLSVLEYEKEGLASKGTISKRFGSWYELLEDLGLHKNAKRKPNEKIEEEDILQDIKDVSKSHSISINTYIEDGSYPIEMITDKFGSWKNAVNKANLSTKTYVDKEDIIRDMKRILEDKGKITKKSYNKFGEWSATTVQNKFGTWRSAKEKVKEEN